MQNDPISLYLSFLSSIRRLSPDGVRKNRLALGRMQARLGKPLLEIRVGAEITQAIIEESKVRRTDWNGGYKDDGLHFCHHLGGRMVRFYAWAFHDGLIDRNPYPKNPFPQPPRREAKYLTDEQIKILYSCDALELRDFVLLRFFLDTGLRVGQVVDVKVEDIDFTERTVKVYIPKVDKFHRAPFTEITRRYLLDYLEIRGITTGYVFSNRWKEKITTNAIRDRFHAISKKVGFRVTPHMKRHTAVTMWVETLGQIPAMQFAGHSDPGMTNHYTHLTGKKKVKMQEAVYKEKALALQGAGFEDRKN